MKKKIIHGFQIWNPGNMPEGLLSVRGPCAWCGKVARESRLPRAGPARPQTPTPPIVKLPGWGRWAGCAAAVVLKTRGWIETSPISSMRGDGCCGGSRLGSRYRCGVCLADLRCRQRRGREGEAERDDVMSYGSYQFPQIVMYVMSAL